MKDADPAKIAAYRGVDPNDWGSRLYVQLAGRRAVYDAEKDELSKREQAGAMLADIISALMELPTFKSDTVHMPLKDLLLFLADLKRGRDHPWATKSMPSGTNVTTASQAELKSWVRAAYGLLRQNHFGAVEAYKHIANGLTKSGRNGRNKAQALRWRLVQAWCAEEETPSDAVTRERIHQFWNNFLALVANGTVTDSWGDTIEQKDKRLTAEFVNDFWELVQLRDRSNSV